MIRICHVLQTAALDGGQRALLEILRRYNRSRYEMHLVTGGSGPLAYQARKYDVPCHHVPQVLRAMRPWNIPRATAALERVFREQGIQVVHAGSPQVDDVTRRAAQRAGVPHLVRCIPATGGSFGFGLFGGSVARGPDGERLVFSDHTQRRLAIAGGLPAERCLTPFRGVDLERFHPQRRRPCRQKLGLDEYDVIIACSTRLEPHKQPVMLADVAAALDRRVGPDCSWKLWVLGHGSQRDALLRRARRLDVEQRLRFLGWHPEPHRILPAADIVVSPARAAGQSLSLIEGLACGVPVVASDIPGHRDVVTDEIGFLCQPGMAEEFAARLARLVFDRHLRQRMGRRARKKARNQYDADAVTSSLLRMYNSLCTPAAPRLWRAAA